MKPSLKLKAGTYFTLLCLLNPAPVLATDESADSSESLVCDQAEAKSEAEGYDFSKYSATDETACNDYCAAYEKWSDLQAYARQEVGIEEENRLGYKKDSKSEYDQRAAYCIAYQKSKAANKANEIVLPLFITAATACTAACAASATSMGGLIPNSSNPASLAINAACDTADLIASAVEFAYDLSLKDGPAAERLFGKEGDIAGNIQGAMTIFGLASGLGGAGSSGARFLKKF